MTVQAIIDQARAAVLSLRVHGADLKLKGPADRPEWLLKAIRANKHGIIKALRCRQGEESEESETSRNLPHTSPSGTVSMPMYMPALTSGERDRLIAEVMAMGKPAVGWCTQRANAYYEKFPASSFEEQDGAAAFDLVNFTAPPNGEEQVAG
jgi:hypothetical protein